MNLDNKIRAKLVTGTEILRLGGGVSLTAADCNELIDFIDEAHRIQDRYENVMDSLSVDYEDMFPDD